MPCEDSAAKENFRSVCIIMIIAAGERRGARESCGLSMSVL